VCSAAPAAVIVIDNIDPAGVGFNDPTPVAPVGGNPGTTRGQQRLNVFNRAAAIWGAALQSNVTIVVQATMTPLTCSPTSGVLGRAGPLFVIRDFPNAPVAGTWYHVALANSLAGVDLSPANDDITTLFNSDVDDNPNCLGGVGWYYGFDHNEGSQIDMMPVLLHELAHGLGFSSFIDDSTGALFLGFPDIYSTFTLDTTTGLHWNAMSDAQRAAAAINDPNVVWDGAVVTSAAPDILVAGTNSGFVRVHAPNPVEPASSISHWTRDTLPNLLMEPSFNSSLTDDLDLTTALMQDIGWSVVADCSGVANCSGHGICTGVNICSCDSGWSGRDCSTPTCNPACPIGQTCVAPNACSVDCNRNGVPDVDDLGNMTSPDCNTNGIPDECDVGGGASADCNINAVPDECESPVCSASLAAANTNGGGTSSSSTNYALVASTAQAGGVGVVTSANYDVRDGFWHTVPPVVIFCPPVSNCDDANICTFDECAGGVCSNVANTYGDVDFNDVVNIFDLFCVLDGFGGTFAGNCTSARMDLEPCGGNGAINIFDLFAVLDAFSGTDPCCSGP